ncbi:MAG TPA: OB-fold nucleic acid binding domain-containing protein, partial [Candidatus Eisenbacteria bacterium]|nr:OB-fold nucleic acid binding domain-containing protein [Candidatus Eisenbacteria bacterium]
METIRIEDAGRHVGQSVRIQGWLTHRRSSGKLLFLVVRDGSGSMQCVGSLSDVGEEVFKRLDALPQESALAVWGTVREDKRAPGGNELTLAGAEVWHESLPYPISPKEHGVEFLMDHRHLWLRSS